jgi:2-polyprenyl-6-hydroxyphenyl methylase/3-demethylubiquinone-9 3-methyltransferase
MMRNDARYNVDPSEITKFSTSAAHWWDLEGEFKTLHQINPLRVNYINQHAFLAGKSVIDVGCGGGILAESMAALGAWVTGIDMSEAALGVAKLHGLESGLTVDYQLTTAEQMAEEQPEKYDVVTCLEMLEHVPDPASVVEACAKLVKPDGHLFFSTLNRNLKSYLFAIVGAEYVLKLLPKNTHDFAKFIRPSELTAWVRKVNLQPQEMIGLHYHPFSKTFSLDTDISVNYLLHAKKL